MYIVEREHFLKLRLLPHQKIEDYNNKIMDMGRRIYEMVQVYWGTIASGSVSVWAGNPKNIQAALTASQLEEVYGYRTSLPSTFTSTGRLEHGQYQSQQIKTTPESAERVPSVPYQSECAAQSHVGDRMSRLEQSLAL